MVRPDINYKQEMTMNKFVTNCVSTALMSVGLFFAQPQAYSAYAGRSSRQNRCYIADTRRIERLILPKTGRKYPGMPKIDESVELTPRSQQFSYATDLELRSPMGKSLDKNIPPLAALNIDAGETLIIQDVELTTRNPVSELVIIDQGVRDKAPFYKDAKPGVVFREINNDGNGLDQLKTILSDYHDLDALHIVSHAGDGMVYIGNSWVTEQLLKDEVKVLTVLDNAMKDGGDVRFYGCNLAAGESGDTLLELIANKANVDVAASSDLTGSASLGGDWDLEISKGNIESKQPFSSAALQDFADVLVVYEVVNTNDTGAGSLRVAITSSNASTAVDDSIVINTIGTMTVGSVLAITDDVSIFGPGADLFTISGGGVARVLDVGTYNDNPLLNIAMSGMTISNGTSSTNGKKTGGASIYGDVVFRNMVISNNVGGTYGGGGIGVWKANFKMYNSVVDGNTLVEGASSTVQGGGMVCGGPSTVTIVGSTISNNTLVASTASSGSTSMGGGIAILGSGTVVTILDSTITGNSISDQISAETALIGGGISMKDATTLVGRNITVSGNSLGSVTVNSGFTTFNTISGGGIGFHETAQPSLFLYNSIIANNIIGNGAGNTTVLMGTDIGGGILNSPALTLQNSLVEVNDIIWRTGTGGITTTSITITGTNNVIGSDPGLSALAFNGGPVKTMAITTGSVAYNVGADAQLSGTQTADARGYDRTNGTVDMGAFEVDAGTFDFIGSAYPSDGHTGFPLTSNIRFDFGHDVTLGTGNFTIYNSGGSVFETIDITSSQVVVSGSVVTVNSLTNFTVSNSYYINIDASAFTDGNGKTFTGITGSTAWNFTAVADTADPWLSSTSPADNATSIGVSDNLTMTFSEAIGTGTGNITIIKTTGDTTAEAIDVTTGSVTISDNVLTINPSVTLAVTTEYYVFVDTTAIDDTASNSYGGISSKTAWSFTTAAASSNNAPTASNGSVNIAENGSYTFTAANFNFADVDGGDALSMVKITTLETAVKGSLKLNGADVTVNQEITKANIDSNLLVYAPVTDGDGSAYDTFGFKVHDGTEYSAAAYTMTLNVLVPTWTGTANWTSTGNWNTSAVPTTTMNPIISSGAVTVSANTTINNLTINSGAQIIVSGNSTLTVSGTCTIKGTDAFSIAAGSSVIINGNVINAASANRMTLNSSSLELGANIEVAQ